MVCGMPEPCKCPPIDSCQKTFLWIHKGVDHAPHPAVGLVLQVGDAEKFPQALGFEGQDCFIRLNKQGPSFTTVEEDGGDKRFVISLSFGLTAR